MSTRRNFGLSLRQILAGLLFAAVMAILANGFGGAAAESRKAPASPTATDDAAAKAAFLAAYPVFMHPRCVNCHPVADVPLQGDDSHLHTQNVQRASDGRGKYALKCTNCHQWANVSGANMPPGSPNWHMPPARMKMVFEGKSAGELCRQLKDPKLNGGRSGTSAIGHLEADRLVLWGWSPGDGRATPPLSHAEFVRKMKEWAQNGAACPD